MKEDKSKFDLSYEKESMAIFWGVSIILMGVFNKLCQVPI